MNSTGKSESHKLLNALNFAAKKHNDQRRKDEALSPYINHPIAVAEILARYGEDNQSLLQAAILHDIIEDTETSKEELESAFGKDVTDVVLEVTDDKALIKPERKRRQVEHAPSLSREAKLVKLADKIMNVFDVTHHPPSHWDVKRRQEYFDWADEVVAGLRGINADLEYRFDAQIREGRKMLHELNRK